MTAAKPAIAETNTEEITAGRITATAPARPLEVPKPPSARRKQRDYFLRPLAEPEYGMWDAFVGRSPQGTLFHSTLWLEASNVPFKLFGCFREDELLGGFAASLTGSRAAGHPHPSLTPYLGLMLSKTGGKYVTSLSSNKWITAEFARLLKAEFNSLQFRCPPEIVDLQPFIWEGYQTGLRYTYRLPVSDLDAVLNNMDRGRRYALATAGRDGVVVEDGAPFDDVMRLSEKTFARQGLQASFRDAAFRFHSALADAGQCRGFLARGRNGDPIAGIWIAWDEKRSYLLISGYDDGVASRNGAALAVWHAIKFTCEELALPEFDFEGSMIPGVEQFFRKFGATLTPTYTLSLQPPPSLTRRVVSKVFGIR